ncbi:MAG TPA: hypothetical protein VMB66_08155 [Candidatus Acidoferrales bacterium]|nr:hypothetical protein [Candidatus Acidoferrales bacterium]
MSSKLLQFSPQASTRVLRLRDIPERWSGSFPSSTDVSALDSWSEYEQASPQKRLNWGAISGLALSVTFSAAFWIGLVVLVERVWK